MTVRPHLHAVFLAAVTLAAGAPLLGQIDTSKPIQVKTVKAKMQKFHGTVMNATSAAITVRSSENELAIRTFTYSPKTQAQMQSIIDKGGYQYGDRVEIQYAEGTDVAVRIKGKPSKPL